jgi:hypothetical protein
MHNDRMEYEWIKNEINERAAIRIESPIRDTIAHGKGPLKILTIPYIPEILKKSVLYYTKGKDSMMMNLFRK